MKYAIELDDGQLTRVLCGLETSIEAIGRGIQTLEGNGYTASGQRMVQALVADALRAITEQVETQTSAPERLRENDDE